jgi:hypothetical protein
MSATGGRSPETKRLARPEEHLALAAGAAPALVPADAAGRLRFLINAHPICFCHRDELECPVTSNADPAVTLAGAEGGASLAGADDGVGQQQPRGDARDRAGRARA